MLLQYYLIVAQYLKNLQFLNFPALNIREAHERPEAMEEASVMMVGLKYGRISQGLSILKDQKRGEVRTLRLVSDYSMPNVSDKVLRIILSYIDYVYKNVWKNKVSHIFL